MAAVSTVEDTLKRIEALEPVIGTIVVDLKGVPLRTNLPNIKAVQYGGPIQMLTKMARSIIRELDPQDDLVFFSVRSHGHEILVLSASRYLLITLMKIHD